MDKLAEEILHEAHVYAHSVSAEAVAEIADIEQSALSRGKERALDETKAERDDLQEIAISLAAKKRRMLIETAIEVAKCMVYEELERNQESVCHIAKSALKMVKDAKEVKIRANSSTLSVLKKARQELVDILHQASDISFKEDDSIEMGGVVIYTESGAVDAQPSVSLEEMSGLILR